MGFAVLRTLVGSAVSVHVLTVFQTIGLSVETAALFAAFIGPAQIAGRLIEFIFGHRFAPLKSAIFWAAVLPAALLLLIAFGAPSALPFAVAYGMSNGMATISLSVLLLTLFDTKDYPSLIGKIALPTLVVQAAAPLLAASAIDSMPVHAVLSIACAVSVLAVGCLVAIGRYEDRGRAVGD
jgi:hypothetical protein